MDFIITSWRRLRIRLAGPVSIWIVYEAVSYKRYARLDSLRFSELGGIAEDVLSGLAPPNSGLPSIRMTPINEFNRSQPMLTLAFSASTLTVR